jgi:hypothetical protein
VRLPETAAAVYRQIRAFWGIFLYSARIFRSPIWLTRFLHLCLTNVPEHLMIRISRDIGWSTFVGSPVTNQPSVTTTTSAPPIGDRLRLALHVWNM